jgi:nicotinamidase-related amidase
MVVRIVGRYYRERPITNPGYESELVELDLKKTALISMHCWDIGCEGGPAIDPNYSVGLCFPMTLAEGERIMKEKIAPALEAARRIGLMVAHITNYSIAMKDARAQVDMDPLPQTDTNPLIPGSSTKNPVITGWAQYIHERTHGSYLDNPPYSEMNTAQVVAPLPGELYVFQTGQFDRALRRLGIENLIYTGFAADMCILRAGGGAEPMLELGYRVFLMRDATIGVEYPDTFDQRLMTLWGVRYFETHCGNSFLFTDFMDALEKVGS